MEVAREKGGPLGGSITKQDERRKRNKMKRQDDDYIGKFHPCPEEAPLHWRQAHWKELRKMAEEKKKELTLDERISNLKKQEEEIRTLFFKIQGGIEVLESLKEEDNEKTD